MTDAADILPSVDVHCHVLPGLDDGPADLAESLELCRALVADGVTVAAATPHQFGPYDLENDGATIRAGVAALQAAVAEAGLPLTIVPGADVRIDERIVQGIDDGQVVTLADRRRHLLLELPHETYLEPLPVIEALAAAGVQTIMTHPERHRYLAGSHRRLTAWLDAGAVLQITAGSLLGDFGRTARQEAWRLVEGGMAALVASDAHDARRRPPRMTAARAELSSEFGPELARALAYENPRRVMEGEWIEAG